MIQISKSRGGDNEVKEVDAMEEDTSNKLTARMVKEDIILIIE